MYVYFKFLYVSSTNIDKSIGVILYEGHMETKQKINLLKLHFF